MDAEDALDSAVEEIADLKDNLNTAIALLRRIKDEWHWRPADRHQLRKDLDAFLTDVTPRSSR